MATIYIITGPAGVGKSTISEIIAKDSKKNALIEGDTIYHLVSGGYVCPWLENNHLDVFWENSIDIMSNFLLRDYDVVFNYIVLKKDIIKLTEKLKSLNINVTIKFIVLLVNEDTIVARDIQRPLDCQMGQRSIILLNEFLNENYAKENILDTTNLSIQETVNQIKEANRFIL